MQQQFPAAECASAGAEGDLFGGVREGANPGAPLGAILKKLRELPRMQVTKSLLFWALLRPAIVSSAGSWSETGVCLMVDNTKKILYEVNENAPLWLVVVMGIQHVMLIYSEIVLLPVIIGKKAGAPMEHILFAASTAGVVCGLATLLQVLRLGCIGSGYTLFMGTSAAYFAGSVATVKAGGFPLLATLGILVVPFEIMMGYFLRHLRHVITPAVGGVILLLVVLSLVPVSITEWMGEKGTPSYASMEHFLIGLTAMVILLGVSLFGSRSLRLWCPILGMMGGLIVSWVFGQFQPYGAEYPWFGWFRGTWPGLTFDLKTDHLPVFATLAVLTVINGVQAIGNSMAVQQVSRRELRQMDYDSIQGTLYGDAVGNILSGLAGTVPNETYSENISILKITGVASRSVGVLGALLFIALPFSPKISMMLVHLPTPVFGGFLMGLAAMMFPSGLEMVFAHGITHRSGLLVGISLCIGVLAESGTFFPDLFPLSLDVFLNSGVATGGLTVITLSLLFRLTEKHGFSVSMPASLKNLRTLMQSIEQAGNMLDLSQERVFRLQLACEEIFMHIAQPEETDLPENAIELRIRQIEGDQLVEIIYGKCLSDIGSVIVPGNMMAASKEELDRLGLGLFNEIVRDLHQANISGMTYIWFKLA